MIRLVPKSTSKPWSARPPTFAEKNGIRTERAEDFCGSGKNWIAWKGQVYRTDYLDIHGPELFGYGDTEELAITDLCGKMGLIK